MKPKRLEFSGINSFSEKAEIDFTKLLSGGIFGIFGDTGSGKTTILNAIVFALYGRVDRGGTGGEIINYNCDKAYVIFEFEIETDAGRKIYRVDREIKKKNSLQKLELSELAGENVKCISEGVKNTNAKIEEIIGLPFEDFRKCIALPQGEFAQFVKAGKAERLALISRLFGLELFGEKLNAAIRKRHSSAKEELSLLQGKLSEYEPYTDEALREQKAEFARLKNSLDELNGHYTAEKKNFESFKSDYEKFIQYNKFYSEWALLQAKDGEMKERASVYEKLSGTDEIIRLSKKIADTEKEIKFYSERRVNAEQEKTACEEKLEKEKGSAESAGYEAALYKIRTLLDNLPAYQLDASEFQKLKDEREKLKKDYQDAAKQKDRAQALLEDQKKALVKYSLPAEEEYSLESLLKKNLDSISLHQEYVSSFDYFCKKSDELKSSFKPEGELYFWAEKQLDERIEHYRNLLSQKSGGDVSEILVRYETARKQREVVLEEKHRLEMAISKTEAELRDADEKCLRITETGKDVKAKLDAVTDKLRQLLGETFTGDFAAYENKLRAKADSLESQKRAADGRIGSLTDAVQKSNVIIAESKAKEESSRKQKEESERDLFEKLTAAGFADLAEAENLLRQYPDREKLKKSIDEYNSRIKFLDANLSTLRQGGEIRRIEEKEFLAKKVAFESLEAQKSSTEKACAVLESRLKDFSEKLKTKKELLKDKERADHKLVLIEKLQSLIRGNNFMEFVAGEYLTDISDAATETLLKLTNGRYFIRYNQGFYVGDNFNSGELRSVNTLSGGETFLVSLSLALALSAAIYAKSLKPIEFFFLDEGFGTLDEKLVDTVMDSLEKLKNTHFSIGLISHVEELKHRIENKIIVTSATEGGSSKIKISV